MKRIIFCLIFCTTIFCGCSQISTDKPKNTEQTLAENLQYPVEVNGVVFEQAPQTVASLSPALTEIIFELGFGGSLTGVSIYCDYPESAKNKPSLGSAANPDINAILELNPELLITQSPIAKKDVSAIETMGTKVLILRTPLSLDDLYADYYNISAIFKGKDDALEHSQKATEQLKNALENANGSIHSFVYVLDGSITVMGQNTFIGDFFAHFGENAVTDEGITKLSATAFKERFYPVSDSKNEDNNEDEETDENSDNIMLLSATEPEYIFLSKGVSLTSFKQAFPELKAVIDEKIIVIDDATESRLERPTARLSETVYALLDEINSVENTTEEGIDNDDS